MGYGSNSVVLSYELDKARIQVSGGGRPRPADERELIPTDDAGARPYRIKELIPTASCGELISTESSKTICFLDSPLVESIGLLVHS